MKRLIKWLPLFFGIAACSWMPHWSCHYYRIETNSSFVVGSWDYTVAESLIFMVIYSGLIGVNLLSIVLHNLRFTAAVVSGILHLTLGVVHITRIIDPFKFEVFGYEWSQAASIREIIVVGFFGITCLYIAFLIQRFKLYSIE